MKSKNIKRNQSGRSMVEMLSVLAIVGIISVGGYAGYTLAMEKYRLGKTIDSIYTLANDTKEIYKKQGFYNGLGKYYSDTRFNEMLQGNANSPSAQIIEKSEIDPPYIMGVSEFAKTEQDMDSNIVELASGMGVSVAYMPEAICVGLLTHDWKFGKDFNGINVGDLPAKRSFTITEATDTCASVYTDENVGAIINFSFAANKEFVKGGSEVSTKPTCGYPGLPVCPKETEIAYNEDAFCEENPTHEACIEEPGPTPFIPGIDGWKDCYDLEYTGDYGSCDWVQRYYYNGEFVNDDIAYGEKWNDYKFGCICRMVH